MVPYILMTLFYVYFWGIVVMLMWAIAKVFFDSDEADSLFSDRVLMAFFWPWKLISYIDVKIRSLK